MVAERAKKYLGLPTSVITDGETSEGYFDNRSINFNSPYNYTSRLYNSGHLGKHLTFKNNARVLSYNPNTS